MLLFNYAPFISTMLHDLQTPGVDVSLWFQGPVQIASDCLLGTETWRAPPRRQCVFTSLVWFLDIPLCDLVYRGLKGWWALFVGATHTRSERWSGYGLVVYIIYNYIVINTYRRVDELHLLVLYILLFALTICFSHISSRSMLSIPAI